MHELRDEDVARRFAAGDQSALADAYQQWGDMVLALTTRWAGANDADDLTQQVFVAAWRSRDSFDPARGALSAWLVGIARNVTNRSFRGPSEVPHDEVDVDAAGPDGLLGTTADDDHDGTVVDRMVLATALRELSEPQRRTLELGYFEGCTQAEVADRLDMPLGTVKSHQRRGLQRLRQTLEVHHASA